MKNIFESSQGKIWHEWKHKSFEKNLLLIHGFMEDHEVWATIQDQLHANLILVDLMGFGKSIPHRSFDFSMKQQAKTLFELLEYLNVSDVFVLGHSMGGYVALELSLLKPGIHIGLFHSTCLADNEERKLNRNKTIEVLERDPAIFIREFYWNLFAEHRKEEFTGVVEKLKSKAEKIPVKYIIETVKGLRDRKDHLTTWMGAPKGSLIISGLYDKVLDAKELEKLAEMGNADWLELKNSGHMGFYEEPEEVIGEINLWLEL